MRILLVIPFLALLAPELEACSCAGPRTPCNAAGSSAAVFTGKVLNITSHPAQPLPADSGPAGQRGRVARSAGDPIPPLSRAFSVIRMEITGVLNGIDARQKEIDIVTGLGGGDCGYPFQTGMDYFVYAFKNAEGQLETGICTRTRPLAEAAEDLQYLQAMAGAPSTGEMRVRTRYPGFTSGAGVSIVAERDGFRYRSQTDATGDAVFKELPPGEYAIHAESDGNLPDDPKVQLYAKGCQDVTLFRELRISGHITNRDGTPASRIEVQLRSTSETAADGRTTTFDGYYEFKVAKPGQYYLGINLGHTPTQYAPYPRWFYPGTANEAAAAIINFSGKPDSGTYDFTLPERQSERVIEGIVLTSEGQPKPRARVSVYDSTDTVVAFGAADTAGRFLLRVFTDVAYRLHAVWPEYPDKVVSAVPVDIDPGSSPLNLQLILNQRGNSVLDGGRKGPPDSGGTLRK